MKQYIIVWTKRHQSGVCVFEQWGEDSWDVRQITQDIYEVAEFVKKYSVLFPEVVYTVKELTDVQG